MGPNEQWQSQVENELRNLKDFSVSQSINQLALQNQQNYPLPSRDEPQEDPTTTGETIWIRMTSKATDASGQIFYSWRRQIKQFTPSGYTWIDNGDAGTTDYYPATGLNNDDVSVTDNKRYPAQWNSATSQWIFFSNQQAATGGMFRWEGNYWMYSNLTSAPTINSTYSANVTMDTASLNAALFAAVYPHSMGGNGMWNLGYYYNYSPMFNSYWVNLKVYYSGGWQDGMQFVNSTMSSQVLQHVTNVKKYTTIGYFACGTANMSGYYRFYGVFDNIPAGAFVPNIGFRYTQPGSVSRNYKFDEADPQVPSYGSTNIPDTNVDLTTQSYTTVQVTFKKYAANGTWANATNSITLTRKIESNETANANNPWIYNYGPSLGNVSHYTFPAIISCSPSTNLVGGNGTISIAWGNISAANSNITNANGDIAASGATSSGGATGSA